MQFKLILIEMQKKYLKVYIFFISSNKPIFKKFRTIDFIEILVRFQVSSTWASRPSCFIKLTWSKPQFFTNVNYIAYNVCLDDISIKDGNALGGVKK